MKILVIGSGAREHAIIQSLQKNKEAETIYALPGNPGMRGAVQVKLDPMDNEAVLAFCLQHKVDFCVVTPDDPLANGLTDCLRAKGIACFGPTVRAAQIESSKAFSKALMDEFHIPTAKWKAFSDAAKAHAYLDTQSAPIVVKADGLARGKGVVVAKTIAEAKRAVTDMLDNRLFGDSGSTIVIEECLTGPEVSVLCLVDGETVIPLSSAMDHKRALDGDEGANTGGMGVIAPNPFYTEAVAKTAMETIFLPTVRGMVQKGIPFSGCLFFGLMLTQDGPKVLEYNARFGDPETEAVLQLLGSDLLTALLATERHTLTNDLVSISPRHACSVVLASGGYPGPFEKGKAISIAKEMTASIQMAGVAEWDGRLVTAGGRVLCVTETGDTLQEAVDRVYAQIPHVHFDGMHYRKDIGSKALNR